MQNIPLNCVISHMAFLIKQPGMLHIRDCSVRRLEFLVHDRVVKFLVHHVRSVSAYLRRHLVTCEN